MSLNKQRGNMYDWITHTWNPIKGICPHGCEYCYMKPYWKRMSKPRLEKKEFIDLGNNKKIFVGSSCDIFAESIPNEWIGRVLDWCGSFDNEYLFQSKDLMNLISWDGFFPDKTTLGITLESNRSYDFTYSSIGILDDFITKLHYLKKMNQPHKFMVTIEPILDFDIDDFLEILILLNPDWVNIGSDSKGHNLPEPEFSKVRELIDELSKFTEVRKKSNLNEKKIEK